MFRGGNVLALITARGGSKGLPRKNVLPLAGKPMIAWSVEAAKAVGEIDRVIISSDDQEIIDAACAAGAEAPFVRPAHLATDESSSVDVAIHAIQSVAPSPEWLVLLQPTSPLRTTADIAEGFSTLAKTGADSVVSLTPTPKSPWWMYTLNGDSTMRPILGTDAGEGTGTRRQDLPPVHVLNGAVYIIRASTLLAARAFLTPETAGFVMPAERSIDVDTAADFVVCEYTLSKRSLPHAG